MSSINWGVTISGTIAFLVFLFGIYKWIVVRGDKRRGELKETHQQALNDHDARLNRHSERLGRLDELIQLTRDDIHRNYPSLKRFEKLEQSIEEKLEGTHRRMTAVSRDVNQALGRMRGMHEHEIKQLVDSIRDAIERSND